MQNQIDLGVVRISSSSELSFARHKILNCLELFGVDLVKASIAVSELSDSSRRCMSLFGQAFISMTCQKDHYSFENYNLDIRIYGTVDFEGDLIDQRQGNYGISDFSSVKKQFSFIAPVFLTDERLDRCKKVFSEPSKQELFESREREIQKSDELLRKIFPNKIAETLKSSNSNQQLIYDFHPDTTILFTDMVGFTEVASHLDAQGVVSLIDHIFCTFDALCDQHGVEKIKTIGDAYMAASGVPVPVDNHAQRIADLALDMLETHQRVMQEENLPIDIRIGIHSGPVVAGVIGRRKYAYDLWGDNVNVASRMESTGIPGEIQISIDTRRLLPKSYRCDIRGNVALKGHGSLEAFLLRGRSEL